MDEQLKQRLVGGAVIVSLIVIFVPMLFEEPVDTEQVATETWIPEQPKALREDTDSRDPLPQPIAPVPNTQVLDEPPPVTQTPPAAATAEEAETPVTVPPASPDKPLVEVPPQPSPRVVDSETPSAWLVQVGSFTQRENATRLTESLKLAKMPAQLSEVSIGGKHLYRVQMLPQLHKKEAEKLIERIKKEFKLNASLLRYTD